jgi:hypothetical protein
VGPPSGGSIGMSCSESVAQSCETLYFKYETQTMDNVQDTGTDCSICSNLVAYIMLKHVQTWCEVNESICIIHRWRKMSRYGSKQWTYCMPCVTRAMLKK